jgi:hypothetical protein
MAVSDGICFTIVVITSRQREDAIVDRGRRSTLAGIILVVLGLALLARQFVEGLGDSLLFFAVGGIFLYLYFQRKSYGILIPGCLLIGLGLGSVGEQAFFQLGGMENVGLGIGFFAIYVIDVIHQGRTHWWPLVPGAVLFLSGLATTSESMARLLEVGWPLLLVGLGLILLLGLGSQRR